MKARLPFAPFAAKVGPVWSRVPEPEAGEDTHCWQVSTGYPMSVIAELIGCNRRTLTRWAKDGVPDDQADRIAVVLRCHPSEIWPEWFNLVDPDVWQD